MGSVVMGFNSLIVVVPYSAPGMLHTDARGDTLYGSATIAGPKGELQPTPGT
jgi:NAD(P)H dehydrogenase (quinone)